MLHGDDFVTVGSERSLLWFKGVLKSKFETKTKIIALESDDEEATRVLNRVIAFTDQGVEYEADQRHAESIAKDMNVIAKPEMIS